jgi:hypothetical protein
MNYARLGRLLLAGTLVVLASAGMVVVAEESLAIEIGAEAAILPAFTTDLWVDLDWDLDGLSVESMTTVAVVPAVTANEFLDIEYSFGWASMGATADVDLYPFDLVGFDVYVGVGLVDTTFGDDGTLLVDAILWVTIFPAVTPGVLIDLDASFWLLTLWSDINFDILAQAVDASCGGEIQLLNQTHDNGSLTAYLGTQLAVLPAFNADMWLDVDLEFGDVALTSETDVALTPFALTQQRFEVSIDVNSFSVYVWGGYSPALDVLAGIGFTYDLP